MPSLILSTIVTSQENQANVDEQNYLGSVTYESKLAAVLDRDARPNEVRCDVSEVHIDH